MTSPDAPLSASKWFLSYSRHEVYMAEAITLALEKQGLAVWFDLQQLEPGTVWVDDIKRGLDEADGVIVLVSRASAASPWVAREWSSMVESGKPILLVILDAIAFIRATIVHDDTITEADLARLRDKASGIIDARADFSGTMRRLGEALRTRNYPHDPIPSPNRFGIPTRLPLTHGLVGGALLLGGILAAYTTLVSLPIYWLMAAALLGVTIGIFDAWWSFIQRTSYRKARIVLVLLVLLSGIFNPLLIPLFAAAALAACYLPDMHRWSPNGQGLHQAADRRQIYARRAVKLGLLDRVAASVGKTKKTFLILFMLLISFVLFLFILMAVGVSTHSDPVAFLLSLLVVALLNLGVIRLRARYAHLRARGLDQPPPTGITFRIFADEGDRSIVEQVRSAMLRAGYEEDAAAGTAPTKPVDTEPVAGEIAKTEPVGSVYKIVVISNNFSPDAYMGDLREGRLFFVVCGPLDDPERFKPFSKYQWVDYRRQRPEVLDAMAEDLLIVGTETISHSFGARQTPYSFSQAIMPGRVYSQVVLTIFFLGYSASRLILSVASAPLAFALLVSAYTMLTILFNVWLLNRISRRDIGFSAYVWVSYLWSILSTLLSYFVQGQLLIGSGLSIDWDLFNNIALVQLALVAVVGYFLIRASANSWLSGWLPRFTRSQPWQPFLQRDAYLWRRHLIPVAAAFALTFALLVPPNPERQVMADGSRLPVTAVLRALDTPVSRDLAQIIDRIVETSQ